jgi:hypothetical protein
LRARGEWHRLVQAYLAERGEHSPRLMTHAVPAR